MSAPEPTTSPVPVTELGYGAASEELDGIIAELERGVIDVDLLEVRLRRGSRSSKSSIGESAAPVTVWARLLPRLEAVAQDSGREDEGR